MHLSVAGSSERVHGTVQVPNSKYHAHRALILASLAPGVSRITGLSDARHVDYTVSLLRALGITVEVDDGTFIVHGGRYRPRGDSVSVGSSGTTLYFMVGLAALADRDVIVTGQKYFQRRPIGPLLRALNDMGVGVSSPSDSPPIHVRHGLPTGGTVHIHGTLSQWISALLLVAPFATHHTAVIVDGEFNERSYVDLTVRMMAQFGLDVAVSADGRRFDIEPNQTAHPVDLALPPDIGSAAFGMALAGIRPADVVLKGLHSIDPSDIDHPEADVLGIVRDMGLPMLQDPEAGGVRIMHDGERLTATEVDCRLVPDMLPVLSTMAAYAEGESVFHHVEHVRLKESDRVVSMLQLSEMGVDLDFDGADLRIRGASSLHGAHLSSFNDHRVLMSLAVAASAAHGRSRLTFPNAYRISYPQFLDAMNDLHTDMQVEKGPARSAPRHTPPAGTAEGASRRTGAEWIRQWAKERPHALAVVDAGADRTSHLSWSNLDHAVDKAAALMLSLGIEHGDRVAVQLPNSSGFVVIAAAAMRIGAVICPIMPIFRQREVAFALKRSQAKLMIVVDNFRGRQHDREIAQILDRPEAAEGLAIENVLVMHLTPGVAHVLPQCENPNVTWHVWHRAAAWMAVDRATIDARAPMPGDAAQLLFTSGTSGEPKGVIHRHESLIRAAWMEAEHLPLNSADTVFVPSPLAHQTGFLYGMMLSWVLGVPEIVQRTWNATKAIEVLNEWEGTFVQAATPFLADLTREVEEGAPVPRALRIFVATGAAVPRALAERATRVLGASVCGAFGTTETGLGALASPSDPMAKTWGTDGKALREVGLRIVDDDGRPVAAGTEGNFELSSPTMFDGYLDRSDLTAAAFTDDGWYRTGDLATLDDGYLRITGRVRDVINRGGEKVPVSEMEQLLYEHAAIDDVAIVAMPDARLGERACAFAVLAQGRSLTFPQMQRYLDECAVSKSYWPERLEVIDSIPRNAVGKVQKFLLREQAAQLKPQRLAVVSPAEKENIVNVSNADRARRTRKPNRTA